MRWSKLLPRLRALLFRRKAEGDLDAELTSHLELQAGKYLAAGMSEEEARRRARIEFGGLEQAREQVRDVDRWHWIDVLARNLKYALRSLRKSPGFSLVAVLILAIGIGSNLAVFSLVDSLLFRAIPVERPEELVRISSIDKQSRLGNLSSIIVDPLKRDSAFRGVCGFNTSYEGAEINGTLASIGILGFTGDCFQTVGIRVQLGRPIAPSDDSAGVEGVAVITGSLWRNTFGGRRDVLGKRIKMAGVALTVVGVAEDRFEGLLLGFPAGIILPLHQEPGPLPGSGKQASYFVIVLARRAPGISESQALAGIVTRNNALLEESVPPNYNPNRRKLYLANKLAVTSAKNGIDYFLRNRFGKPLYAVFGICATILLIACVNLANLLLARNLRKRREIGMRLALGARRTHIAGMLALESSILVLASAGLGVLFALWLDDMVVAQGASMFGNFSLPIGFDWRVTLFLAGAVLLIAGAFAGAAAWQSGRLCSAEGTRDGGRGVIGGGGRAQKILIASQIALTLALVAGGSLFGSSLRRLYQIDLGVKTERVWDVMLSTRPDGYSNPTPGLYYRDLLRQIELIPGVSSATLSNNVPYYLSAVQAPVTALENADSGREPRSHVLLAADGFFKTLGIRMIAGEDFHRDDLNKGEPLVIVSESLAAQFGDPAALVGQHIRIGNDKAYQRLRISGVVSNAELDLVNPSETKPLVAYINLWEHLELAAGGPVLLIKTIGGALDSGPVRRVVDSMGIEYVERFRTLDAEKDGALVEGRTMAFLSGAFGVLALVMAATGLFGLLSYQVANRTSEIGVRMALGARRIQIQWLVVRQVLGLLVAGCIVGIGAALAVGKAIQGLLYGVRGSDAVVLGGSVIVLAATALIAAWLPARRASAVDPVVALRHE
jgi:predicted permease